MHMLFRDQFENRLILRRKDFELINPIETFIYYEGKDEWSFVDEFLWNHRGDFAEFADYIPKCKREIVVNKVSAMHAEISLTFNQRYWPNRIHHYFVSNKPIEVYERFRPT